MAGATYTVAMKLRIFRLHETPGRRTFCKAIQQSYAPVQIIRIRLWRRRPGV